MGKFNFIKTEIDGVYIIGTGFFGDNRGYFMETYNYNDFKAAGLDMIFVQDNQSSSRRVSFEDITFKRLILRANSLEL